MHPPPGFHRIYQGCSCRTPWSCCRLPSVSARIPLTHRWSSQDRRSVWTDSTGWCRLPRSCPFRRTSIRFRRWCLFRRCGYSPAFHSHRSCSRSPVPRSGCPWNTDREGSSDHSDPHSANRTAQRPLLVPVSCCSLNRSRRSSRFLSESQPCRPRCSRQSRPGSPSCWQE